MPSVAAVAYHAECVVCGDEVFLAPADEARHKAGAMSVRCTHCAGAPVPSAAEATSALYKLIISLDVLRGAGYGVGTACLDEPKRAALRRIREILATERMLHRSVVEIDMALASDYLPESPREPSQQLAGTGLQDLRATFAAMLLPTTIEQRIAQIRRVTDSMGP